MGQGQSVFEEKQLELYQDCTYFTREEILSLYRRFSALDPENISPHKANVTTRVGLARVQDMPELRENPFRARMCEVFSTDGNGLHFEDFLDLFSVFSARAPWDLKATYAFRVYDFDGDAAISRKDIDRVLECLTGGALSSSDMEAVVAGVIEECDISNNQQLSYTEFEHVISRAPDFVNLFHITL